MTINHYWESRYKEFINSTLRLEKREYERMAAAMDKEIECLIENKEEYLKDNPKDFVLYMYINHELNILDPIGCCYPTIPNEYSDYAWDIVDIYKKQSDDNFEGALIEYLWTIYDSTFAPFPIGNDINIAAKRIMKALDKLCKSKKMGK